MSIEEIIYVLLIFGIGIIFITIFLLFKLKLLIFEETNVK